MLKRIIEESKRPAIVLALDNSRSVGSILSSDEKKVFFEDISVMKEQLETKYDVTTYSFGKEVTQLASDSLTYTDDITDLSSALQYINDIYEGEHLGAVVLATDGIYNTGQSPLYASIPSHIPIHGIALGDTTRRRDIVLQAVLHNEVAYLNDQMITQVDIKGINASNQNVILTVEKESNGSYEQLDRRTISLRSNDFFKTEDINLSFEDPGVQHYRYSVSTVPNESNQSNNRKDIYIEVLDARQEIGIIAAAPHPDVAAFKQLLEENKNYQVVIFYENPSASELANLDLVILHNLPSDTRNLRAVINTLDNRKTPRMYVIGGKSSFAQFNQLQNLVTINGRPGSSNDAQPDIESSFENFTLSDGLKNSISRYPPLSSPFGEYLLTGNVQTLMYQNIGDITTDFPLLSFADVDDVKTAFLFGNDIWRWKLYDYLQNENFGIISELIDKTIIYTSTKEDKRKFRVSTSNNVYYTSDEIILSAELYNNNYELINDPEVVTKIIAKSYVLDIGRLGAGSYTYSAETIFNSERYTAEGRFVVREVQFELYDLEAQHNLLYALSTRSNGSISYLDQVDALTDRLLNADDIKPVLYQNVISKPLLDSNWLFLLLVIPLILEWVLRRYHGSL